MSTATKLNMFNFFSSGKSVQDYFDKNPNFKGFLKMVLQGGSKEPVSPLDLFIVMTGVKKDQIEIDDSFFDKNFNDVDDPLILCFLSFVYQFFWYDMSIKEKDFFSRVVKTEQALFKVQGEENDDNFDFCIGMKLEDELSCQLFVKKGCNLEEKLERVSNEIGEKFNYEIFEIGRVRKIENGNNEYSVEKIFTGKEIKNPQKFIDTYVL